MSITNKCLSMKRYSLSFINKFPAFVVVDVNLQNSFKICYDQVNLRRIYFQMIGDCRVKNISVIIVRQTGYSFPFLIHPLKKMREE